MIFGPRRLKSIGSDLGNAIRGFRKAVTDDEAKAGVEQDPSVIEGEAVPKGAAVPKGEAAGQKTGTKQETNV